MNLNLLKQLSISVGLYKPARRLHRALHPRERADFSGHQRLLSNFVQRGDLAFDVGANIGTRTECLLSLGACVVAFEPQPTCAKEIRARGNNCLTVLEKALGSTEGRALLHIKKSSGQSSLLAKWQGQTIQSIDIPVGTLDSEIAIHGVPVFCKIDVEGFELEVLNGLSHPLNAISFEYHCDQDGVDLARKCIERISALGRYEANLIGEESPQWLDLSWSPAERIIDRVIAHSSDHFYGDIFMRRMD